MAAEKTPQLRRQHQHKQLLQLRLFSPLLPTLNLNRIVLIILLKKPTDSAAYNGKVNVVFKLEYVKFGPRDYQIYQQREFSLDRESDLIIFNDVVGVKFYRITATEFGQVKNYFKYKLFAYEQGVWLVVTEQEQFAEMSFSKKKAGNLSKESTATSVSSEKFNCAFSYSFLKSETP